MNAHMRRPCPWHRGAFYLLNYCSHPKLAILFFFCQNLSVGKKARDKLHRKIIASTIEAIQLTQVALVWKMQSGLFNTRGGGCAGVIGIAGVPDICGITNTGKFLGIEAKVPPDKQNPNQRKFAQHCDDVGAHYFVIDNMADIPDLIAHLKKL